MWIGQVFALYFMEESMVSSSLDPSNCLVSGPPKTEKVR